MNLVHFTNEALSDIEDIAAWYEKQRHGLSHDFELCLEAGVFQVSRQPESYQKRYKNVKIKFISRFPYGIHYLHQNSKVTVIGIFHTSRSPLNWSKRI